MTSSASLLKNASILVALHGVFIFLLGIPPFDHVALHLLTKYHPVARQLKVVYTTSSVVRAHAVAAGLELGVFDVIHKSEKPYLSASEIAEGCGNDVSQRGMETLLEALASADYLYVDGEGKYTNSATVEHHLISGLPPAKDMTPLLQLMTSSSGLSMSTLTEAVRAGGSVMDEHAETDGHSFWELFAEVTGPMSVTAASDMVQKGRHLFVTTTDEPGKKDEESTRLRVLDVASGSGEYGFAVAQKFDNAKVTLLDYENVLAVTSQNAARQGIDAGRLEYLPGNLFEVDLPDDAYDVVLAPNIIHHFTTEKTIEFFDRMKSKLRPGGHVLVVEICRLDKPYTVFEGFMDFRRTFSTTMLTWTKGGKAFSEREMVDMMTRAGLVGSKKIGASFPFSCFVAGQRPKVV